MQSRFDRHLWLARTIAIRLRTFALLMGEDDLHQAALTGLWLADQRAGDMPDAEFVKFAGFRIKGEIHDELRRMVPAARRNYGDNPVKPREASPAAVALARDAGLLPRVAHQADQEGSGEAWVYVDGEPSPDAQAAELETWRAVHAAIAELPERWRGVLLRRLAGEPGRDVASSLGVTEVRVSQIVAKAVSSIAAKLAEQNQPPSRTPNPPENDQAGRLTAGGHYARVA